MWFYVEFHIKIANLTISYLNPQLRIQCPFLKLLHFN